MVLDGDDNGPSRKAGGENESDSALSAMIQTLAPNFVVTGTQSDLYEVRLFLACLAVLVSLAFACARPALLSPPPPSEDGLQRWWVGGRRGLNQDSACPKYREWKRERAQSFIF